MKNFLNVKYVCLILISALTGCSTYKESFDCPVGSGVQCRSISQVDQMVDKGVLPSSQAQVADCKPLMGCPQVVSACSHAASVSPFYKYHNVVRIPEQHLRIWIGGFHDQHGNFHDENVIYTVLRPGQWVRKG